MGRDEEALRLTLGVSLRPSLFLFCFPNRGCLGIWIWDSSFLAWSWAMSSPLLMFHAIIFCSLSFQVSKQCSHHFVICVTTARLRSRTDSAADSPASVRYDAINVTPHLLLQSPMYFLPSLQGLSNHNILVRVCLHGLSRPICPVSLCPPKNSRFSQKQSQETPVHHRDRAVDPAVTVLHLRRRVSMPICPPTTIFPKGYNNHGILMPPLCQPSSPTVTQQLPAPVHPNTQPITTPHPSTPPFTSSQTSRHQHHSLSHSPPQPRRPNPSDPPHHRHHHRCCCCYPGCNVVAACTGDVAAPAAAPADGDDRGPSRGRLRRGARCSLMRRI